MQGRVGEVAAEILTDFPERFADRRRLFLLDASGSRRELLLENFWPHKERLILKFAGIDSMNDAEALVGGEVQIPVEERAPLEQGAAYISDLVGCRVFASVAPAALSRGESEPDLRDLGVVTDVLSGAGEAPLLQIRQHCHSECSEESAVREYLIPFAQEYITRVDTAAKRLELNLPEGMLELDAPLSSEEKEAQKNTGS